MSSRFHILKPLFRNSGAQNFIFKRNFHSFSQSFQENKKNTSKGAYLKSMFPLTKIFKFTLISFGAVGMTVSVSLLGFFIYDSTTYPENTWEDVFSPDEILNPKRGGPENLPIMETNLDKLGTPDLLETKESLDW